MKRQLESSPEAPAKRPATETAAAETEKVKETMVGSLKASEVSSTTPLFGNFGSFSFGSIKPKANPFGEPATDNPWAEPAPALGNDQKKDKYAQVELKQQTVQTGEENESTLFSSRARLYALSFADTAAGWKERGIGLLKINVDDANRARIVMRSEGLLRVVLNTPLAKNTQIGKGFKSSLVTEKFVQFVGIEKDVPHKYALKLPSKELAVELFEVLNARPETVIEETREAAAPENGEKSAEPEVAAAELDVEAVGPAAEPAAEEPAAEEPAAEESAAEESVAEESAAEEPATEEPAAQEPTAEESAAEEPATEEPAAQESAAEEPVAEEEAEAEAEAEEELETDAVPAEPEVQAPEADKQS